MTLYLSTLVFSGKDEHRTHLPALEDLDVPRCFKPFDFGIVDTVELRHFSDA